MGWAPVDTTLPSSCQVLHTCSPPAESTRGSRNQGAWKGIVSLECAMTPSLEKARTKGQVPRAESSIWRLIMLSVSGLLHSLCSLSQMEDWNSTLFVSFLISCSLKCNMVWPHYLFVTVFTHFSLPAASIGLSLSLSLFFSLSPSPCYTLHGLCHSFWGPNIELHKYYAIFRVRLVSALATSIVAVALPLGFNSANINWASLLCAKPQIKMQECLQSRGTILTVIFFLLSFTSNLSTITLHYIILTSARPHSTKLPHSFTAPNLHFLIQVQVMRFLSDIFLLFHHNKSTTWRQSQQPPYFLPF